MLKKLTLLILISGLLTHCGFTPMHSKKDVYFFSIASISFQGDKTINNFLKVNLSQFQNNKYQKKFIIEVNTKYNKNILSKDKTAKITDYELLSNTVFKIFNGDKFIREIIVSEKKNMNNMNDKFEEQKYERSIKQNFASSISNKLITELSLLDDY